MKGFNFLLLLYGWPDCSLLGKWYWKIAFLHLWNCAHALSWCTGNIWSVVCSVWNCQLWILLLLHHAFWRFT